MEKVEIKGIEPAKVLKDFLWTRKKKLKLRLIKNNTIEVEQDSILELLLDFQKWQIEQINANNTN
ncbi:MAG TPA: hypothetical protein PKZ36_00665 [Candidatus Paceibacterota bacterium]|nr:hypothetical protein [Candidatus Paceibacterota bacterium]HPT17911.1 hypothetical protein [Candidatus Paceibacterota bacterium]